MQQTVSAATTSSLTTAQARFVRLMQRMNFGRIECLAVRRGQPVMSPLPRVLREVKFGGDNGPRPEITKDDFELKVQVRELFAQMEAMGDGTIRSLEVRHGLPFRMTVEEVAA
jgi:hypothetical protein